MSSCFSRCLRVPIAMRRFYEQSLWIPQKFLFTNLDLHHGLLGPYSSSLTTAAAEIAEEHKKILWNYGGTSDEIFSHGRRCLVGIASPASDYLRELPRRLAEEFSEPSRICVLYSGSGSFGWQVARGILRSAFNVAGH